MRIFARLPRPTSPLTACLLLITCLFCFFGSALCQSCHDKCQAVRNYYSRYLRSPALVQYYHQSCLNRCYDPSRVPSWNKPRTTTTTTTTTTTPPPPPAPRPPPSRWRPPFTGGDSSRNPRGRQASCGVQSRLQFRVIGGSEAEECEFPWVVGVLISRYWCGGSILDRRHILTAAHCFKERQTSRVFSASDVTVTVGSSKTYLQTRVGVRRVNLHPRHIPHINDYDVAVLTLDRDLTFSDCVSPICLPVAGSDPFDADFCEAAGWGITEYSETATPPQSLQKVELPLVSQSSCMGIYARRYINELKLCAGDLQNGGVDTCRGDSGGPLMCKVQGRYVAYGIVSFGSVCGARNRPGIYTNVVNDEILDFIHRALLD